MILDPYIVKAASDVTAKQVYDSFAKLYADVDPKEENFIQYIEGWLIKLRKKPGTALSTGRRNSSKGVMTCALLDVLGVDKPKAARCRSTLAWTIIKSPRGRRSIGPSAELDAAWLSVKDRFTTITDE